MIRRQNYGIAILLLFLGIGIVIGISLGRPRGLQRQVERDSTAPPPLQVISTSNSSNDSRYNRAPKPERDWLIPPDLSAVVNSPTVIAPVATRGLPDSYQSFGIITVGDKVYPLYGRQLASRSGRFQYYTRTDTYNPVQLPIRYNNRDCQDDIGCEELFDNDQVQIPGNGTGGRVSIYKFSGPTYVPIL